MSILLGLKSVNILLIIISRAHQVLKSANIRRFFAIKSLKVHSHRRSYKLKYHSYHKSYMYFIS